MDKLVTFIIPVRIDSTQRRENLLAVVEYLRENLKSKIMLMEGDKESAFTNNEKSNFANKEVDCTTFQLKFRPNNKPPAWGKFGGDYPRKSLHL